MYWALFVNTVAEEAFVQSFEDFETPQLGPVSGQSFGSDREGAYKALKELEDKGYRILGER